jgi:hypothetical protein
MQVGYFSSGHNRPWTTSMWERGHGRDPSVCVAFRPPAELTLARSFGRFDSDVIVHGDAELLLAPEVFLGGLDAHVSEKYLGCKQKLRYAVNDKMGIEP